MKNLGIVLIVLGFFSLLIFGMSSIVVNSALGFATTLFWSGLFVIVGVIFFSIGNLLEAKRREAEAREKYWKMKADIERHKNGEK